MDFDPVRAKAAGQPPPGLKPQLAALFPDAFQDSELGEIPKGWRVKSLPKICDVNPTRTLARGTLATYLEMDPSRLETIWICALRKTREWWKMIRNEHIVVFADSPRLAGSTRWSGRLLVRPCQRSSPESFQHQVFQMEQILKIDDIVMVHSLRQQLGYLDPLVRSIKLVGLLQPPIVTPDRRLISGKRRIVACMLLGWTEIPVMVADTCEETSRLLFAERHEVSHHLALEDLDVFETGRFIEKLSCCKLWRSNPCT